MSLRFSVSFLATIAAVACMTGCGGGQGSRRSSEPQRYSKAAFVACVHKDGAVIHDISKPRGRADKLLAEVFSPIAPNFVAARFSDSEFVGIAFAADPAGAGRILDRFKKLARQPGTTVGRLTLRGNIVLLTNKHATVAVAKALRGCEADSIIR
jgi:hypothetical protein